MNKLFLPTHSHPFERTISVCSSVSKSSLQTQPSYPCPPWHIGPPMVSGSSLVSAKGRIINQPWIMFVDSAEKFYYNNIVQHRQLGDTIKVEEKNRWKSRKNPPLPLCTNRRMEANRRQKKDKVSMNTSRETLEKKCSREKYEKIWKKLDWSFIGWTGYLQAYNSPCLLLLRLLNSFEKEEMSVGFLEKNIITARARCARR